MCQVCWSGAGRKRRRRRRLKRKEAVHAAERFQISSLLSVTSMMFHDQNPLNSFSQNVECVSKNEKRQLWFGLKGLQRIARCGLSGVLMLIIVSIERDHLFLQVHIQKCTHNQNVNIKKFLLFFYFASSFMNETWYYRGEMYPNNWMIAIILHTESIIVLVKG